MVVAYAMRIYASPATWHLCRRSHQKQLDFIDAIHMISAAAPLLHVSLALTHVDPCHV